MCYENMLSIQNLKIYGLLSDCNSERPAVHRRNKKVDNERSIQHKKIGPELNGLFICAVVILLHNPSVRRFPLPTRPNLATRFLGYQ